nr:helix-hairpin-helix domain-containing protein [Bacteroidia bacterium]
MNVKFGSCFVLLLVALSVNAQNDLSPDLVKLSETELETMTEKTDSEQEDYQHYDALEQYLRSPLNLNKSSLHELEVFPFLDDMRIAALLQHRENFGEIIAIEELQLVPGFDADLIRTIKPLVSLGNLAGQKPISVKNLVVEGTNTLMIRVQKKIESGNTNESLYPGSDEKIYLRYKYQFSDRIRFGFTAEKDPGEYFFNNSRTNGFDFYSGHLIYKSKSFIRQIIIGDFAMQHGQGLVMWSGMGLGKSSEVLNIQKNTIG